MLPSDQWDECSAGTISRMVAERGRQQRRVVIDRALRGGTACLLVVAGIVTISVLISQGGRDAQAMTCDKAAGLFAAYHDELLGPDDHRQVEAHLRDCPHCREAYRNLYAQEARNRTEQIPHLVGSILW